MKNLAILFLCIFSASCTSSNKNMKNFFVETTPHEKSELSKEEARPPKEAGEIPLKPFLWTIFSALLICLCLTFISKNRVKESGQN